MWLHMMYSDPPRPILPVVWPKVAEMVVVVTAMVEVEKVAAVTAMVEATEEAQRVVVEMEMVEAKASVIQY